MHERLTFWGGGREDSSTAVLLDGELRIQRMRSLVKKDIQTSCVAAVFSLWNCLWNNWWVAYSTFLWKTVPLKTRGKKLLHCYLLLLYNGVKDKEKEEKQRGRACLGERLFLKHLEEKSKLYLGILSGKQESPAPKHNWGLETQRATTSRVSAPLLQQESVTINAMDSIPEKNMSEIYQKRPTEIDVSSYSEIWTRALVTLNPSCALLNIHSSQAL